MEGALPRKPPLTIVANPARIEDEPPATLGEPGRNLWRRVMTEYQIEDAGGLAMLEQCCAALDRAERLRVEIESDGEVIRTRGTVKDHPALKHELAARSFVCRTLSRLGLDVEPVRSSSGRPPGGGLGWTPPR
jgi:phage terminase small subunit